VTEAELRATMALGREQRGAEFKGPGKRTDKSFLAKVVRAILAMANKPGGGVVVLGVEDDGVSLHATGLSQEEAATWSYDHLASSVSNYADPYVDFDVAVHDLGDRLLVVIEVREFDDIPVLCKKDCGQTLRRGALYVRRRGRNETVEVPSHVEFREILNRASELLAKKIIANYVDLSQHVRPQDSPKNRAISAFDREAEDLL